MTSSEKASLRKRMAQLIIMLALVGGVFQKLQIGIGKTHASEPFSIVSALQYSGSTFTGDVMQENPAIASDAPKESLPKLKNIPEYFPRQLPISQISISVRAKSKSGDNTLPENGAELAFGPVPTVPAAMLDEFHSALPSSMARTSSSFSYQPLYFEQANVERYGRSRCRLSCVASAMRFYATIPTLPYAMTVHHPNQNYFWHWPYKAGWYAPAVRERPPLNSKGSLVQSAAITGLFFLVP